MDKCLDLATEKNRRPIVTIKSECLISDELNKHLIDIGNKDSYIKRYLATQLVDHIMKNIVSLPVIYRQDHCPDQKTTSYSVKLNIISDETTSKILNSENIVRG